MAPKPREHATYIKPGVDREAQLRIDRPVRADLDHVRKLISRQLDGPKPSLGVFIAFAASVGADLLAHDLAGTEKVHLESDLARELDKRNRRPIKQELLNRYRQVYRGLPPAKFGEFIVFAAQAGAQALRERYSGSNG